MMVGRISGATLAICLASGAAAEALECRPILVARALFCDDGTSWDGVPLAAELDDKQERVVTYYGQRDRVWLVFSRIPEDQVDDLPWWPGPDDVMQVLTDFAGMSGQPLGEEIERFYPLGEEVMAASLATRNPSKPYVNIYTYYFLKEDKFVLQTGIEGASELTEAHKALHLEAVRAIKDPDE